jgi:xylan 1,4-beta-xylosidase
MGDSRIALSGGTTADGVNGVATVSNNGQSLQILVYNHVSGGAADSSQSKVVTLTVNNLSQAGPFTVRHYLVDQSHANSYTAWTQMGKPAKPTASQWTTLSDAANLCYYETSASPVNNTVTLTFPQKTYSVSLITIQLQ